MPHYLRFGNGFTCTVNGETVASGYELHDGDVILAKIDQNILIHVNSEEYYSGATIDIYDSDIEVSTPTPGGVTPY